MKFVAFIPARLESKRFPNKVLKLIFGIPMIEHVRRRAIISNAFNDVFVATDSKKIQDSLKRFNSKIVLTKKKHHNGTSRISEISKKYNFDYAAILFADEPFINPKHLSYIVKKIPKMNNEKVINITTNLKKKDLNSKEVVKTIIDKNNYIIDYFKLKKKKILKNYKIKKSSGILILDKKLIEKYKNLKTQLKEKKNKIEQFRFLENNIKIKSVFVKNIYPSVNTKKELKDLLVLVKKDKKENKTINKVKKFEY